MSEVSSNSSNGSQKNVNGKQSRKPKDYYKSSQKDARNAIKNVGGLRKVFQRQLEMALAGVKGASIDPVVERGYGRVAQTVAIDPTANKLHMEITLNHITTEKKKK